MSLSPPIAADRVAGPAASTARLLINKVPEVTLWFWIIKILCTTVGETFADYLAVDLHLGLTNTTYVMSAVLVVALIAQFRSPKYVPGLYWFAVVAISVVGTLITDKLVDDFGVPLETTTIAFTVALAATFLLWFRSERTLSIHSIVTPKREAYYWTAILFTFALGTAAGDLIAERMNLGYGLSVLLFAVLIGLIAMAHFRFHLNDVATFWAAYILTRPLGASMGDFTSQAKGDGGLGWGTTGTSLVFLTAILGVVVYLSITGKDRTPVVELEAT